MKKKQVINEVTKIVKKIIVEMSDSGYKIVDDDRSGSQNKTLIKVPKGRDISDAEIWFSDYIQRTEGDEIKFGQPRDENGRNGVFLIRWESV